MSAIERLARPTDQQVKVAASLIPGDRVRVVDWRNESHVDGTMVGFWFQYPMRRLFVGPAARLCATARAMMPADQLPVIWRTAPANALHGRWPGTASAVKLCVQRDFACGTRAFQVGDLVAQLDGGATRDRARRILEMLRSISCVDAGPVKSFLTGKTFIPTGCAGCLAYVNDPRDLEAPHVGGMLGANVDTCPGVALVPEMAVVLEELGIDPWATGGDVSL